MAEQEQTLGRNQRVLRIEDSSLIHPVTRMVRGAVIPPVDFFFPDDGYDQTAHLDAAGDLFDQGYGAIVPFNHFAESDSFQLLKVLGKHWAFREREVILPMARHHFEHHKKEIVPIARALGVTIYPLVIPDTLLYEEFQDLTLGEGMRQYLSAAKNALSKGAIVALAPQVGRRSQLGEPEEAVGAVLMSYLWKNPDPKVFFLPAGLSIVSETDYSPNNVGGYNFRRQYHTVIDRPYTITDVLEELGVGEKDLTRDPRTARFLVRSIDQWMFQKLACLVSEDYRGKYSCTDET